MDFIEVFNKAKKKYGKSTYRLAGEGWDNPWQTLITTVMSAQSRDETTIPIAENLFARFPTLESLANAQFKEVLEIFKSLNYNRTKAKHVIEAAQYMLQNYNGSVPDDLELLIKIPGVGRKTANLIIGECFQKPGICVDTHVHRISNVLQLVNTKTPTQTEFALQKVAPKHTWNKINRLFVLWGKDVPGNDAQKLLNQLEKK